MRLASGSCGVGWSTGQQGERSGAHGGAGGNRGGSQRGEKKEGERRGADKWGHDVREGRGTCGGLAWARFAGRRASVGFCWAEAG